ncbi:MAG TPA: hypothetical protein VL625_03975 [Patescibacteria group bacterium]|nr:hypothetical protein [Patescibacteria group bacterium]
MTDMPKSGELAADARQFVRDNKKFFWDYLKPLLLPFIVMDAIAHVGATISPAFTIASLVTAYISACFVLAWHRAVLLGPQSNHAVNPFLLKKGEGGFILIFFLVAITPAAVMMCGLLPVIGAALTKNMVLTVVASLVTIVAFVYAIILGMSFAFVLPARSVGVKLSFREARKIARGLIWKLFWTGIRVSFGPAFLIGLWYGIMAVVVISMPGMSVMKTDFAGKNQEELTMPGAAILYLVGGLPLIYFHFMIVARNITVLSKLYQWSVQNRAPEQAK